MGYYRTPSPWLQIKLLKFLQMYPNAMFEGNGAKVDGTTSTNRATISQLTQVVSKILTETDVSDSINKSNADHAVLFEAINLIVCWGQNGPSQLRDGVMKHQATVIVSLKDADISVRRRALDLLFVMCDTDNAERIVDELVAHLILADAAIREEMVLKIAILAEKYATDLR